MGVDLGKLVEAEKIEISSLKGKKIAIDAFNSLYQFLSIIRQPDGTPLMDSNGNVTSHLTGLFYRTARFLEAGLIPCYVFDGKPPQLKAETVAARKEVRKEADKDWKKALSVGDLEAAKKYAQRASKLDETMISESKQILDALGVPHVQAPSEGEAQASYMCQQGDVWIVGSQDFDSLLFGAPRLVRNLNITGKRKIPGKNIYTDVKPEILDLEKVLNQLEITKEQLIEIGILIGTDFNQGINGIGPKKALIHAKAESLQDIINKQELEFEVDPLEVEKIFTKPEVTKEYKLEWGEPSPEKLLEILHEKHEFSKERINSALEKLEKAKHEKDQKSLEDFF